MCKAHRAGGGWKIQQPTTRVTEIQDTSRACEDELRRLCLIHCDIDQLTIHPRGGHFSLGSGDATLRVEEGTVEMETIVRYAVILHGPFVYSAGYKPASVVVYLNLEGANLLKPLKLMLKHWCKPVDGNSEAALKLLRAPHTIGDMENSHYIFHEVQGVLLHNTATFTISEPECLYCVEMKEQSKASYNAIAFQKSVPEGDLVKFRLQLMCNSLNWNMFLTEIMEKQGWENSNKGDPVSKFFFCEEQITATPSELHGPGWQAAIHGHQSVRESDFLDIQGKDKDAVTAEVENGRYPPCIYYQVLYTGDVAKTKRGAAFWRAELQGADVPLFFSCKILQELAPQGVSTGPLPTAHSQTSQLLTAGEPLAKRVLMDNKAEFLKVLAVYRIYRELCEKKVIDRTVEKEITKSQSVEEARGHLFDHMRDYGTLYTLKVFCDVITSEEYNGIQAMQDFGAKIKRRLAQEGEQHHVSGDSQDPSGITTAPPPPAPPISNAPPPPAPPTTTGTPLSLPPHHSAQTSSRKRSASPLALHIGDTCAGPTSLSLESTSQSNQPHWSSNDPSTPILEVRETRMTGTEPDTELMEVETADSRKGKRSATEGAPFLPKKGRDCSD